MTWGQSNVAASGTPQKTPVDINHFFLYSFEMPTIKIQRSTSLNADEAYDKLKTLMDGDDLKKLDPSFSCQFQDADKKIVADGKKFKAKVDVKAKDSGSDVDIVVDLPLMLSPFKGAVQSTLEKKLDRLLA